MPSHDAAPAPSIDVGIIGGSGLSDLPGLEDVVKLSIETPFGPPAGPVRIGRLGGVRVGFLARHGAGHAVAPAEAPYRANVMAMKQLGARSLLGVTAVGSLREHLRPGDLALPDDLLDRTTGRPRSFFGPGLVAHIGLSPAYCEQTRAALLAHAPAAGRPLHDGGTLVVIDGPRFSTKAESRFHRQIGADLVGMTALPEASLAREAELPYVSLAVVTDYDVWHPTHGEVSVAAVLATMAEAVDGARSLLVAALPTIAALGQRPAHDALAGAIQTAPEAIDPTEAARLHHLVGRYVNADPANPNPRPMNP